MPVGLLLAYLGIVFANCVCVIGPLWAGRYLAEREREREVEERAALEAEALALLAGQPALEHGARA